MSTKEQSLSEVRDLLADVLDVDAEQITEDTHFINDLGVDSLMALEVMVAIEKRYRVTIPEKELRSISCLRNVMSLLEARGVV